MTHLEKNFFPGLFGTWKAGEKLDIVHIKHRIKLANAGKSRMMNDWVISPNFGFDSKKYEKITTIKRKIFFSLYDFVSKTSFFQDFMRKRLITTTRHTTNSITFKKFEKQSHQLLLLHRKADRKHLK